MARRRDDLSKLPPRRFDTRSRPFPVKRYDWETWADGSVWELTSGEDFVVAAVTFKSVAKRHAATIGKSANLRVLEDGRVLLQFVARPVLDEPPEA